MTSLQVPDSTALAVRPGQTQWTPDQLAGLQALGVDERVDAATLAIFLNQAQRTGLDPFNRQLYLIRRGGKYIIQTGIDGLRVVAERSGRYAGQTPPQWCGPDGQWCDLWPKGWPTAARIGVYKTGFDQPLWAVAMWGEYCPLDRDGNPTSVWREKPALMLVKCAEALALRKAFPHDLSGLYTAEEMGAGPVVEAGPPPLNLEEIMASVDMATSLEEFQHCWRAASQAGVLDRGVVDRLTGEVMPLRDLLMARVHATDEAQPAEATVVGTDE